VIESRQKIRKPASVGFFYVSRSRIRESILALCFALLLAVLCLKSNPVQSMPHIWGYCPADNASLSDCEPRDATIADKHTRTYRLPCDQGLQGKISKTKLNRSVQSHKKACAGVCGRVRAGAGACTRVRVCVRVYACIHVCVCRFMCGCDA